MGCVSRAFKNLKEQRKHVGLYGEWKCQNKALTKTKCWKRSNSVTAQEQSARCFVTEHQGSTVHYGHSTRMQFLLLLLLFYNSSQQMTWRLMLFPGDSVSAPGNHVYATPSHLFAPPFIQEEGQGKNVPAHIRGHVCLSSPAAANAKFY